MTQSSRFWATVGLAVGVFWLIMFFMLLSVRGPIFGLVFYGAMYLTCPPSLALRLFGVDIFLVLAFAPFLNALTYGLIAYWWIHRKDPKGPPSLKL